MEGIIAGDETWDNPETKRQSSQCKSSESPRPKKARRVLSKVKDMLIVFLIWKGLFTVNTSPKVKQ
jgi:hypothetical protein